MKSIKQNYLYNVLYQLLIIFLPLITAPYVARTVGASGLGIYTYTFSIAQYFSLFILLGVSNYGNRSIAQVRDNNKRLSKTFFEIYSIQFLIGIPIVLIYIIYALFISTNAIISLIQVIYLISVILDISWFFFGIEQFKVTVTRNVIIKILSLLCIFAFVKNSDDLVIYTLILTIATFINQFVLWLFLKKNISFTKVTIKGIIRHIKPNLLLFIPVIATSIYILTDKIMLGIMGDMTSVGLYEYADKIRNIPMGLITALGVVMLPKITNMIAKGNKKAASKYLDKSFIFTMFCAFAFYFGILGISNVFIPIFYGKEFIDCVEILNLLVIAIMFISWANVIRTQILIPNKKDNIYIISTILGAIINIILNLILIKRYGVIGAAIATVVSEIIVASYQTIKVRKYINWKYILHYLIQFIIIGFLMFIVVKKLGNYLGISIVSCIIQVVVGALLYLIVNIVILKIRNDPMLNEINKKKFT